MDSLDNGPEREVIPCRFVGFGSHSMYLVRKSGKKAVKNPTEALGIPGNTNNIDELVEFIDKTLKDNVSVGR